VTPYDTTHIGHARTFLTYDVLIRRLRSLGVAVTHVRNVTDVDDSILKRAAETGEDYLELGERFNRIFEADMQRLNALPPDVAPRATQEIANMIRLIEKILARGRGYIRDGTVYCRVSTEPRYGSLSRLDRQQMTDLNRQFDEDPDDPRKEDPLDFPVWKAAAPGEPTWESPWGPGRPGWHIECTAMSDRYLGPRFDLHGGGQDLIFPHHENELVQSSCTFGAFPFADTWMHTGLVAMGGTKMSKSLGNMAFARDLLPKYSADAIRLYLLGEHYQRPLDYEEQGVARAEQLAQRIKEAARSGSNADARDDARAVAGEASFLAALDNNLDTPKAFEVLGALSDQARSDRARDDASPALGSTIRRMAELVGLTLQ
jgi:L-cysteine:1D-myo-inositol 2-amino-2-deoxy-alpha-D-glucopyranoside ligase